MLNYELIQARNYTKAEGRIPRLICIHSMEAAEKPGTARAVAKWFASPLAPQASAHYCIDSLEIIQCVRERDVAWAAPSANRQGVHIELAGFAGQDTAAWDDEYSRKTLALAAQLAAEIAFRYAIPLVKLSPDEVKGGAAGICGHHDCTLAFKTPGGHTDPGKSYPWQDFISRVQANGRNLNGDLQDA